jgi:transcriptional regulator with XRE-family HTH domain
MEDTASRLNQRIAERVRELRAADGLSLDTLASKSGVSRSMISLIERGESSPTAVVLEKLAAGLGVTLASLFDAPAAVAQAASGPVARRGDQPQWQVWVLEGAIDITLGEERHRLREGDCLAMQLDRPTMFHNPTRKPVRYAVVIASDTPSKR